MPETLYPKRQRCKTCGKGLKDIVLDGLYDSYKCAGVPEPKKNIDAAPRNCKRMIDGKWGWKTKYKYEGAVPQRLRDDPATNVYRCDYCHYLHVGHSRPMDITPEQLRRTVSDLKTLGSVIQRYREQRGIDKKLLAKTLRVPAITLTEVENGDPKMDVAVLFATLNILRLSVEITGK
jgi:DNA-binding XRE family transcriptional regulator